MPNTSRIKRHKKQYRIRFGIYLPMCSALTEDISARGLFIKTVKIVPAGTLIEIELTMPNNNTVSMKGIVRWAKSDPAHSSNILHESGMGVEITKFIRGEEIYQNLIAELQSKDKGFVRRYGQRNCHT